MKLIDTHCHINFSDYKEDADEVIQRSLAEGTALITVGSQWSTSERAVAWAEKYDQVWAAVGLHPSHLYDIEYTSDTGSTRSRAEVFDYDAYKKLAQHEKVVAIGEMGVEYFHMPPNRDPQEVKKEQEELFEAGIALSQELDKPLIIHTRSSEGTQDSYDAVLEILKRKDFNNAVVHCFLGTKEYAKKLLDLGLMFSFTGIVTFKNAVDVQESAAYIPLEQIMVETDAPYLTPEPHRGKRNEPAYVKHVAERIAKLKGVTFEEVSEITTKNAQMFFNIK